MGGGGGGGGRAVDNGWEGNIRFCRLYGVKLSSLPMRLVRQHVVATLGVVFIGWKGHNSSV